MKTLNTVMLNRVFEFFETKVGEPVRLGRDLKVDQDVTFTVDDVVRGEGKVTVKLSTPFRAGDVRGDGDIQKEITFAILVEGK